jgi:hypothetical protein
VNKYLEYPTNPFIIGSASRSIIEALALMSADAVVNRYCKSPGPSLWSCHPTPARYHRCVSTGAAAPRSAPRCAGNRPAKDGMITRIRDSVGANTDSREADSRSTGNYDYGVREAVGVFAHPASLERAVDELEIASFDRAVLSVLAANETIKDRVGHLYRNVAAIEDNRRVPQAAFAEMDSRIEGEAIRPR